MIKNFHLRNYISNMKTYLKFGNLEASNGKIYPNLKNIKKKNQVVKKLIEKKRKEKKRSFRKKKKNHSSFNVNQ